MQRTFDADGRTLQVSRIAYINGKPGKAQLQVRYEFAKTQPGQKTPAFLNPILIARPSVIAGREAITRITYNPAGQPIEVTETGFSPLADQAPANFKRVSGAMTNAPDAEPTELKRTTRYRYRTLNGRSVLSEIDGPLPNGPSNSPSDSDVTRIEIRLRVDSLAGYSCHRDASSSLYKRSNAPTSNLKGCIPLEFTASLGLHL